MEDYYEYLDSNGVTTLYKLIKDDTVALIDSYSVTINGITTTLDTHINDTDIHTPISDIESMVDTKIAGLVNSAPETLDTLKELADALGNDSNFATTVVNQIGNKADKDDVYTKQETDTLLEDKANSKHTHVVSDITDFPTIPTKVSELSNDSNFVTSTELHDYATKNDLNSKQDVLSEEQLSNIDSIPDKANKSDLSTVATSGSYKDLLDKPVIPEGADLSDYYNKGETDNLLNSKANTSDLAVVAKSGNYSDLINTPTIPTKVSDLTNDSGYITGVAWGDITSKPSFSDIVISGSYNDLVDTPTIPTKTSELTNDSGYITSVSWEDVTSKPELSQVAISGSYSDLSGTPTIPTKTSQLINDSGFITGISWDKVTNKPTLATVATSGSYTDLSNTPTIPTKVSQLENDMGFGTGGDTSDCVHKTGDETIAGDKAFTNTIFRKADITTSTVETVYKFTDSNASPCGSIYNRMHWYNNNIHNRHQAFNATSGKDMYFEVLSHNDGSGVVNTGGSVTNNKNLTTVTNATNHSYVATMGWVNNPATSTNVVHRSGNETIKGIKFFDSLVYLHSNMSNKNSQMDLFTTPANTLYAHYMFVDKNNEVAAYMQYGQQNFGIDFIGLFIHDKNRALHGIQVTTNNEVIPISNNTYSLGSSGLKWANVYATTLNGTVHSTNGNAFMAQNGSYTFLIRNDGSNTYLLMSDKDGVPGTWSTARPLIINNSTGVCSINGHADSATYAETATYSTTPATSNNSTRIATTAWVRNYVNSVGGNNTVGPSVSAYWSNNSNVTATGQAAAHANGIYPACYSEYITKTPTVGTMYSGAQLYTVLNTYASATGNPIGRITNVTAQATFSNPISPTGKYLCTTANTVRFRAYVSQGTTSGVGTASVVDNSSAKSIFTRIE